MLYLKFLAIVISLVSLSSDKNWYPKNIDRQAVVMLVPEQSCSLLRTERLLHTIEMTNEEPATLYIFRNPYLLNHVMDTSLVLMNLLCEYYSETGGVPVDDYKEIYVLDSLLREGVINGIIGIKPLMDRNDLKYLKKGIGRLFYETNWNNYCHKPWKKFLRFIEGNEERANNKGYTKVLKHLSERIFEEYELETLGGLEWETLSKEYAYLSSWNKDKALVYYRNYLRKVHFIYESYSDEDRGGMDIYWLYYDDYLFTLNEGLQPLLDSMKVRYEDIRVVIYAYKKKDLVDVEVNGNGYSFIESELPNDKYVKLASHQVEQDTSAVRIFSYPGLMVRDLSNYQSMIFCISREKGGVIEEYSKFCY